jgi:hypothetical protein
VKGGRENESSGRKDGEEDGRRGLGERGRGGEGEEKERRKDGGREGSLFLLGNFGACGREEGKEGEGRRRKRKWKGRRKGRRKKGGRLTIPVGELWCLPPSNQSHKVCSAQHVCIRHSTSQLKL